MGKPIVGGSADRRVRKSGNATMNINQTISTGREHFTTVEGQKLFLWEKPRTGAPARGTILFVHGSSMASTPCFDLQAPGYVSAMDFFAAQGFDCWCCDHRGYGRSYKGPEFLATIAQGADDLAAASQYIMRESDTGPLHVYGISSGALRAALFAERHPERVKRLALDAFVWTGKGSPTLAQRREKLPQWKASTRRPINRAFLDSIHRRDNVYTANPALSEPYAQAVLALDDSIPNGTYIDMCENLPVNDPAKVTVPTIIMRGQYDGIAAFADIVAFFTALPNADKELAVMPDIAHGSFTQMNYMRAYHVLLTFFTRPEPVLRVQPPAGH
jgi:pimeloyl-ACP methyl ester carboxylesterase